MVAGSMSMPTAPATAETVALSPGGQIGQLSPGFFSSELAFCVEAEAQSSETGLPTTELPATTVAGDAAPAESTSVDFLFTNRASLGPNQDGLFFDGLTEERAPASETAPGSGSPLAGIVFLLSGKGEAHSAPDPTEPSPDGSVLDVPTPDPAKVGTGSTDSMTPHTLAPEEMTAQKTAAAEITSEQIVRAARTADAAKQSQPTARPPIAFAARLTAVRAPRLSDGVPVPSERGGMELGTTGTPRAGSDAPDTEPAARPAAEPVSVAGTGFRILDSGGGAGPISPSALTVTTASGEDACLQPRAEPGPAAKSPETRAGLTLDPKGEDSGSRQVSEAPKFPAPVREAGASRGESGKAVISGARSMQSEVDGETGKPVAFNGELAPASAEEDAPESAAEPGGTRDLEERPERSTSTAVEESDRDDLVRRSPATKPPLGEPSLAREHARSEPSGQLHRVSSDTVSRPQHVGAGDSSSATKQTAGEPYRPVATLEEAPRTTRSVEKLELRVGGPGADGVDVEVAGREGRLRVAVRTADHDLTLSLRGSLSNLVNRLDAAGFRTETWIPHFSGAFGTGFDDAGSAGRDSAGHPGTGGGGERGQQSGQQGGQGQREHPDWSQEPDWNQEIEHSIADRTAGDKEAYQWMQLLRR